MVLTFIQLDSRLVLTGFWCLFESLHGNSAVMLRLGHKDYVLRTSLQSINRRMSLLFNLSCILWLRDVKTTFVSAAVGTCSRHLPRLFPPSSVQWSLLWWLWRPLERCNLRQGSSYRLATCHVANIARFSSGRSAVRQTSAYVDSRCSQCCGPEVHGYFGGQGCLHLQGDRSLGLRSMPWHATGGVTWGTPRSNFQSADVNVLSAILPSSAPASVPTTRLISRFLSTPSSTGRRVTVLRATVAWPFRVLVRMYVSTLYTC
jgi:hypothetical protein